MTVMQVIMQFHFCSMAECRRTVNQNFVKLNGKPLSQQDLEADEKMLKVGDVITIGRYAKHTITEDHLTPVKE